MTLFPSDTDSTMNQIGHRVLLFLFLICLPFNGVNSGIIGNPICQDDEYYDEERDVCLDDCGGLRCAVEQICSDRLDGYVGPRACKNKCYEDCDIKQFCNSKTGKCDPCSSICIDLRKCRHLCYDVYKNLPQTTTYSSMEMTTMDATPAYLISTSEAAHFNDCVIAASVSIPVLVILALAGVTAAVIYRRKNSGSERGQESQMLPTDGGESISLPINEKVGSSIKTNDFLLVKSGRCDGELSYQETTTTPLLQTDRGEPISHTNKEEVDVRIVKSLRTDEKLVTDLHQTLQSRQVLAQTEIRKAEIGYQLVNYLQQCDHENLETARQEMNHVLQGPVVDLNQLLATARKHTIDTFTPDSEESILKWLLTKNAVQVVVSEAVDTLELLMMHGPVSAGQTTAIIQDSNCKCLCLCNDKHIALNPLPVIPKHIEEFHVCQIKCQEETLKAIGDVSSIRALTVVLFFPGRAEYITDIIKQLSSLQAFGFRFGEYVHEEECNKLWKSLQTKGSIECVILYIDHNEPNAIDLLVNIILNVESLQELWVSFWITPTDDVLERIAKEILKMPNIKTISVVGEQVPVNVTPFLNVIGDKSNISTIYSDHCTSQLPERFTASFKGELVRVRSGASSCFFTPLMYSRFLLTSIPLYIKNDLFNKYVSRSG